MRLIRRGHQLAGLKSWLPACVSVALALVITPAPIQAAHANAELKVIDSTDYPWHSIGRVNRAGYKSVSSCTGTLIAPNLVLTAAHCIVNSKTKKMLPADEVLFIAGVRRDKYAARLEAQCLLVPDGYVPTGRPRIGDIRKDLGLIVLKEPSTLFPLPPLTPDESRRLRQSTRFLSVGYRRSRPYLPTVVSSCSILGSQEDVWITDCNTESGASGGPLMVNTIFGPRVAAIMSSKINDERSIVVPFPEWQDLIASASCEGARADEALLTGEEDDQKAN
nr:trypsin-like peptidase domain-containing protein [uncultured Roseibium sp.]